MRKNNIKILEKEELKYFNDLYSFEIKQKIVFVKNKNFSRITIHPQNSNFSLATPIRRLTITKEAIDIFYKNFYLDKKYTLIDVQNAMNKLIVLYQKPDLDSILKMLESG